MPTDTNVYKTVLHVNIGKGFTVGMTPRKYSFVYLCRDLDLESAVTAKNDEFNTVFIARLGVP